MVSAREYTAAGGVVLGLFMCDPPLGRFYERAGLTVFSHTVIVGGTPTSPFPSDALGKVTVGSLFTMKASANAADFLGSRIELFPGEIDCLW